MSTVIKDLGAVSAYAYAVEKGYTGTEAEFAELMADYAEVGQRAEDAADSALESKTAAQTAATTATNKASEATTAATTATAKAGEASTSASTATSAKDTAVSASQTATTKATEATTAAATATSAATTATTAKDDAVSAKTAAQTAQTGAETAAASVAESAAQIQTNAEDISQLKSDFADIESDGVVPSAEQILSDKGVTDSVPYHYRKTGGDGADRLYDQIVGGTVCFNQLVQNGNFADGSGWTANKGNVSVASNKLTFTLTEKNNYAYVGRADLENSIVGHKYFVGAYITVSEASSYLAIYRGGVYSDRFFALAVNARTYCAKVLDATASNGNFYIYPRREGTGFEVGSTMIVEDAICHDLTAMFGSTVADYIYQLEQTTAGAGVALFKSLFPNDYYEYNTGELKSVEGVSAHVMRDADSNIIGNYPLDNSLTLRGIPKLSDGKMYFDGDRYLPDGTVERRYGIRTYQSGDESLADAITDGTNTVYKLTTMTIEESTPYRQLQICDPNGTEEFVSTGIVPVGHETRYPENLRAKIEGLPWDFSSLIAPTEKTTTASRNYTAGSLLIMGNVLYKVTANIANGGTITPNTNVTATTLSEILSTLAQ